MKASILNIILITFLIGCAPGKQTSIQECLDFDELKFENDQFLYNQSVYSGCARKVHGKLTVELQLLDGKKNGLVKQFKNNVLIQEGNFKDNLLDGIFKTFYSDGSIKSTVMYKNGLKEGHEKIYWETGELGHFYHYSQDKLVDTSYSYYQNGKRLARIIHLGGFGNSEEIRYLDSTQTTFMSGSLRNGNSVGDWMYKFSSDSCFVRHYNDDTYNQTQCNCDTLNIPKI